MEPKRGFGCRPALALGLLLAGYILLLWFLPLKTAVKIGGDEDFAVSKAYLVFKGYRLYTDIWNDQPPLHTVLLAAVLRYVSPSILALRLVTITFALLLLSSLFVIVWRIGGMAAATIAAALLIVSPGFLELSSSCMVEIPAVASTVAALCILLTGPRTKWHVTEIFAGIMFGVALQIKMVALVYLPLAGLILWSRHGVPASNSRLPLMRALLSAREPENTRASVSISRVRPLVSAGLSLVITMGVAFVVINLVTGHPLLAQFEQARASHLTEIRSHEYGSPADRPFDWSILLKHWDTTVPALLGAIFLGYRARWNVLLLLPLSWLALTFVLFPTHQPWWSYYYVHNAIPLCWCAAMGVAAAWMHARTQKRWGLVGLLIACCLLAGGWAGGRVYVQVGALSSLPRTYSSLVLGEIKRFKPFTKFLFTDEPVYAFHTDIPLPPTLAMLSLKRFWSGDMSNARLVAELAAVQPGLILVANDSRELPFHDWLHQYYRLVYHDDRQRLYADRRVIEQVDY